MPLTLLLLSGASAQPCATSLDTSRPLLTALPAACPHLAPALERWAGKPGAAPDSLAGLCSEQTTSGAWRACHLRRDGLFTSPADLERSESLPTAILASRLYAALLEGGQTPEPAARAAARQVAGLDPAPPRPVRGDLPGDLPYLPARSTDTACVMPVLLSASGAARLGAAPIAADSLTVEAGLWSVYPTLRTRAAPDGCAHAEVAASAGAPAAALVPLAESLWRAGFAEVRLLGMVEEPAPDRLTPLSYVRLRLAPGGDAPDRALRVTLDPADPTAAQATVQEAAPHELHLRWAADAPATVGQIAAVAAAAGPGLQVVWLDTRREAVAPIRTPAVLEGALLLSSDPDRRKLDTAVDERLESLYGCYREALTRRPTLSGRVEFDLAVASDGAVSSAQIRGGSLVDDGMHSCMLERLTHDPLPAVGRPAVLTYRLTFSTE